MHRLSTLFCTQLWNRLYVLWCVSEYFCQAQIVRVVRFISYPRPYNTALQLGAIFRRIEVIARELNVFQWECHLKKLEIESALMIILTPKIGDSTYLKIYSVWQFHIFMHIWWFFIQKTQGGSEKDDFFCNFNFGYLQKS